MPLFRRYAAIRCRLFDAALACRYFLPDICCAVKTIIYCRHFFFDAICHADTMFIADADAYAAYFRHVLLLMIIH